MARAEAYPQPGVAYEARETVKTITDMAAKPEPPPAAPVEELEEPAVVEKMVEKLPPVVEEQIAKKVRFSYVIVAVFIVVTVYLWSGYTDLVNSNILVVENQLKIIGVGI